MFDNHDQLPTAKSTISRPQVYAKSGCQGDISNIEFEAFSIGFVGS
jgi:hypothetical protein